MAITTNNGPKANPGEIKQALNFLKELLPNKLVTAIGILLHPCCNITATVEITCNTDPSKYDLVFTLSNPLSFPGITTPKVLGTITGGETIISEDGKTVTITGATITASPATFFVYLFYETTNLSGAFRISDAIEVGSGDIPICS